MGPIQGLRGMTADRVILLRSENEKRTVMQGLKRPCLVASGPIQGLGGSTLILREARLGMRAFSRSAWAQVRYDGPCKAYDDPGGPNGDHAWPDMAQARPDNVHTCLERTYLRHEMSMLDLRWPALCLKNPCQANVRGRGCHVSPEKAWFMAGQKPSLKSPFPGQERPMPGIRRLMMVL